MNQKSTKETGSSPKSKHFLHRPRPNSSTEFHGKRSEFFQ